MIDLFYISGNMDITMDKVPQIPKFGKKDHKF